MLYINNKTENSHRKAFTGELFVSLIVLSVFSSNFAQASDITADMVIKLTNKARESANIVALKKNELLTQAAQNKAQDMIDNNYFAHVSPQGKSPWNWIQDAGFEYRLAGENLAINFTNAEEEQKAWMDSELHRKNILNSEYEEIGVAVKKGIIDGQKTTVTVQEFGTRMPQIIAEVKKNDKPIQPGQKNEVAGAVAKIPVQVNNSQEKSDQAEFQNLLSDNAPTLFGWFGIFLFAIIIAAIDVAAIFHKKHRQLLILHDARNK